MNLPTVLFNSAILYTLGNYHVVKYGQNHFLKILGLLIATGSITAGVSARNDASFTASGGSCISGGLIAYHAIKNPAWFQYAANPFLLLSLFAIYSAYQGDRAAIAGLGAGYAAFLFAL